MASDSSLEGVILDPSKCSKLSMEEKRELVYEISKRSHGAEALQSWSRQEILQVLCAEMGKERKYTGLTKLKIIENLLKLVSEKKAGGKEASTESEPQPSPPHGQKPAKRQRKTENPSRLPVPENSLLVFNGDGDIGSATFCKNSACKAALTQADAFCRRCSCCICHQYDDNKDPSLWLICSSESPFVGDSCGLSCHLECALKHDGSGIAKVGDRPKLDGSFYCVSCGKVNDLLGCWRKQLMVAKDTRRVDILCYRVSISQRLLQGTEKFQKLYEIVNEAVKKLESEVGPLTGSPAKIGRGIVNRLSSGPEVQKLCAFALESLDLLLSERISHSSPNPKVQDTSPVASNIIRFEDVAATSLTVILGSEDASGEKISYILWHRTAHDLNYPEEPTCTLLPPNRRFSVRGLVSATEYCFKVVSFTGSREIGVCEFHCSTEHGEDEIPNCSATDRSQSPVTNCSSLSNPSSVEDETNNSNPYSDHIDNRADYYLTYHQDNDKLVSANVSKDAINCSNMGGEGLPADADSLSDKQHAVGTEGCVPSSDLLKLENKHSSEGQVTEDVSTDDGSNSPVETGRDCVPFARSSEAGLPITPCKLEIVKDGPGRNRRSKSSGKEQENGSGKRDRPQGGSTSMKRSGERRDEVCAAKSFSDRDFEYYVKVIRWLECEGHIEKNFRQKFLTWYSLRATPEEVKIVKVYVDTFMEDPASLAEQLVDTFSECISSKKTSVPAGICMKLWH